MILVIFSNWPFLSTFKCSGFSYLDFGQVIAWLIPHLTKMVEESFVVSCLIEFLVFPSGRDQLGKMMKLEVNGKLLSTFSHSFLFTQDFGQLKA